TMAEGVNGMVNGHIAVKKKAMACVAEFGRGNFEAELEKFPGKKRFINDTIEKVRENLKALIVDANMLSEAALAGQLATRADAKRHEGDFRKIVEGVNATLDAVVVPVNEVKRVMVALSEGDLTQKIQGNY
ncbi:methyl-accepting chemotaxis protein, partial [Wenzhouxiangella sp. XN24]|nr:methyl-accepting chemotaxis protein [Wenzhouxiangella sp. XN24]